MLWEVALAYAEAATIDGKEDWRLPSAKELQSLLDYARSPDTTASAAIDPLFTCTSIINEEGADDYPYYWTNTTHISYPDHGQSAAYLAFGRGLGYMNNEWQDVHGAGCQRSDPKVGDPNDYPTGHGPQGDAIRIYNYVRLVRDADVFDAADMNCDGAVDAFDIDPFIIALLNPATYAESFPNCNRDLADMNQDGGVNAFDIDPFIAALLGG